MPYTIKLKELPCGYAATSARKGETVTVQTTGFASSEDGDLFIRWLDGVSSGFLSRLPARIQESTIDNLFVVVRTDRTATVYVNEAALVYEARVKRAIEAGEAVMKDDIADIARLKARNVEMPPDAGLLVVLSAGWRKGLFFDYGPLPDGEPRSYDIEVKLGAMFAYLLFQDRLRITDEQWDELLKQRWYPFVSLSGALTESILSHVRERWKIDDLLDRIVGEAKGRCAHLRANAVSNPLLAGHKDTIRRALDHLEADDYLSCATMLYPRIEGVLRTYHAQAGQGRASQRNLAQAAVADPGEHRHEHSLLMPKRFQEFLELVYFAHFDPADIADLSEEDVSRHTVAHGIAPEAGLSAKAAVLAVLILDQLAFLMGETKG